ncbi:MAG: Fic family protein, partial [Euryarchaeota archaeon]|nr:Fic family protein [Euryarchaeota archaeon]
MDPVIAAGVTHYEIARIHPFIDGNGRTARI